jgi:rare lipoprotein A
MHLLWGCLLMLFNLKSVVTFGFACVLLSGCSAFGGKPKLASLPPAYPDPQSGQGYPAQPADYPNAQQAAYPQGGANYPSQGQGPQNGGPSYNPPAYNPSDAIQYDEVGYAGVFGEDRAGAPTALGEQYNPNAMSAAHATLPLPSFIEVTNLNTGKTLLVRVIERSQPGGGRLIDLSPAALSALGAESGNSLPIRVRRVNPSEPEKSALAMGRSAGDRLATPEPLLIALRKKLGTSRPTSVASAPPQALPRPVKTQPRGQKPVRPGANYDPQQNGQVPERQVSPTAPNDVDDGYVREDAQRPAAQRPTPASHSGSGYFIQIAAFSDRNRADGVARQMGARIERAGTVWRVRKGPYPNEAAARAALGPIAAKGYRDARVTH